MEAVKSADETGEDDPVRGMGSSGGRARSKDPVARLKELRLVLRVAWELSFSVSAPSTSSAPA